MFEILDYLIFILIYYTQTFLSRILQDKFEILILGIIFILFKNIFVVNYNFFSERFLMNFSMTKKIISAMSRPISVNLTYFLIRVKDAPNKYPKPPISKIQSSVGIILYLIIFFKSIFRVPERKITR